MEVFYEKHGPAKWDESDDEMGTDLTMALNKLCAQPKMKKNEIREMADEFCWYFMLSMKWTFWRLVQKAVHAPAIIPTVVEVSKFN